MCGFTELELAGLPVSAFCCPSSVLAFLLQHRVAIATGPGRHGNDGGRTARCNPQTSRSEARFELKVSDFMGAYVTLR